MGNNYFSLLGNAYDGLPSIYSKKKRRAGKKNYRCPNWRD